MAVTFGKTATIRTGGGARLIVTHESQITLPPWTLSFTDIYDIINGAGQTNTQIIPENTTLYFELGQENWTFGDYFIYKNSIEVFSGSTNTTISFNVNDTLYIYAESLSITTTMTIKQTNSSGRVIDTFNITLLVN